MGTQKKRGQEAYQRLKRKGLEVGKPPTHLFLGHVTRDQALRTSAWDASGGSSGEGRERNRGRGVIAKTYDA